MAKIDVIQEIFDSFELIKAHYKEVIVPLIILLLISAGASGGSSLFRGSGSDSSYRSSSQLSSDSLLANAMSSSGIELALAALSGVLLALLLVIVVIAIVLALLHQTLWFYVWEHFHAIINKRKIAQDWQPRFKRLAVKAVVLGAFELAVLAVFEAYGNGLSSSLIVDVLGEEVEGVDQALRRLEARGLVDYRGGREGWFRRSIVP